MTNSIEFPNSIYDFLLENSFKDTDEVYTNGSLLIPTFRVKQAIEHYYETCEDCISREDAKNLFWDGTEGYDCRGFTRMEIGEMLDELPSAPPSYNSIKTELKPCEDWKFYYKHGYAQARNNVLDKIRAEIEKLNPVDCGLIYSFGARDMKEDVLGIIDKYKAESEDKK